MEYIVVGGDERFAHLARMLKQRGREVGTLFRDTVPEVPCAGIEELRDVENVIANYPLRLKGGEPALEGILNMVPDSARIFLCGPKHPDVLSERIGYVDLWADEGLVAENARLTAEGAISAAMRASSCAIKDMRCMVIGWGRIGRALTELLVALGARTTVASRSAAGRNRAVERGAEAAFTGRIEEALAGHRLILNTASGMVLDEIALKRVDRDAMIIDLASPPYGVDLHAAWNRGLRAWREPGLPGRYCPESAARAILSALARHGRA